MAKFEIIKGVLLNYYGFDSKIIIPNNVKKINHCVFCHCQTLEEIIIPDSVISIGDYVFENCYHLTKVTLGKKVSQIGIKTFNNCYCLKEFNIYNNFPFTREHLCLPESCKINYINSEKQKD